MSADSVDSASSTLVLAQARAHQTVDSSEASVDSADEESEASVDSASSTLVLAQARAH